MFKKVLIANRGEIACRIERTLSKMGIKSVAVYTKADEDSLHVKGADEAVLIGDGPANDSYLNPELILSKAIECKAEAIHPGYGFLSENADFVRICKKNGITFIGPTAEQLELFGLKHSARLAAEKADVPLPEGTGLLEGIEDAIKAAARIGYPVMLKSTAGGGGIGMRICVDEKELKTAFDTVGRLAKANFNNDGVFLEKYIEKARHVEVQIFGSKSGEVVTIGERDCSIQRRNQKVMEETPAPNLPDTVRKKMYSAAVRLAESTGYRSAGTVEFLYDVKKQKFYFLEVNTRLQVEHGITEEVYGIDLVEWMIREAAGETVNLAEKIGKPKGHSIEARIYAEDSYNNFAPSTGRIDSVEFPDNARVETWIEDSVEVTSFYDPMLAKIIVSGKDREEALKKMKAALEETKIYGLTTNVHYLYKLAGLDDYKNGNMDTHLLDDFSPEYQAFEVLDGGIQTTIQDYPGRIGYWDVGVPPSGPMDSYAFRIGNSLLKNDDGAPGIELTLKGGNYRFRSKMTICITGADMRASLDGKSVPMYQPFNVSANQVLSFGEAEAGMRTYLLVEGGIDVPKILGSSSTFTLGIFGGLNGRALRTGDVISVCGSKKAAGKTLLKDESRPQIRHEWTIGVIPGPHCTEEFLKPGYLEQLTSADWKVHFNSSRTGVRLIGPTPDWSRQDGGEAGLHPSNIHDTPYSVGALDLTGDMPIFLGPDGPSLGGFVCPVTVASAELWKIGQLHPGDKVHLRLVTLEEAQRMEKEQDGAITDILNEERTALQAYLPKKQNQKLSESYPILYADSDKHLIKVTIRLSGDSALLVEYGDMELDLKLRFMAHSLMLAIQNGKEIPYIDLTPGIRSLQIHIDTSKIDLRAALKKIIDIESNLPPLESVKLPSRIVELPLSWNDPKARLAMQRYQQNVRPDAPWCPDNIEFIRRINGLDSIDDVYNILFNATYLVMGLGDVYLGAPVAVPLDPRHRLVTTKYNPARTWTPENAVGIGGAYMCVYGVEGPGGYQLCGRTVQMWNRLRPTKSFVNGKPWLLRFFDQIKFYPVDGAELRRNRDDFLCGKFNVKITETTFELGKYLKYIDSIKEEGNIFKKHQQASFDAERKRWHELGLDEFDSNQSETAEEDGSDVPAGCEQVCAKIPGSIWKVEIHEGDPVKKNQTMVIMESMKMEISVVAPYDAIIRKIKIKPGDIISAGHVLLYLGKKGDVLR